VGRESAAVRADARQRQRPKDRNSGDQDASAPIQLTGRKTADLSDAALRVYPGAGHGLYASDHQAVNADILRFIRGTPDGPADRDPGGDRGVMMS
jgi:pimeloyl-ACP methyl ester carboxylesterase